MLNHHKQKNMENQHDIGSKTSNSFIHHWTKNWGNWLKLYQKRSTFLN